MPIREEKGQSQSVKTIHDQAAELQELLKGLTPAERTALQAVINDLQNKQKDQDDTYYAQLKKSEYIREPVSIEQFLKDPYYLGETCSDLYPAVYEDMYDIEKNHYEDFWWIGSTRTAKCAKFNTEIYDVFSGKRRQINEIEKYKVTAIDENSGKIYKNEADPFYSGKKECLKIINSAGDYIEVSKDHRIFTPKGWIEAQYLKSGDYIASPRFYPEPEKYLEISDNELKLVAYMLSDGGLSNGNCTFTNSSDEIKKEFCEIVKNVGIKTFYGEPQATPRKSQNSGKATDFTVRGISQIINKWNIRGHAEDKRIPSEFYGLNKRQIGLFLNRFWACDGSICLSKRHNKKNQQPSIEISLASENMIRDIKFLLGRLEIYSRIHYKTANYIYRGEKRSKPAWKLTISSKENILKFLETVGLVFSKEHKCQNILNFYNSTAYEKLDCSNTDTIPLTQDDFLELMEEFKIQGIDLHARKSKFKKNHKANYSRSRFKRLCKELNYCGKFKWLANSDLYWESIVSIENTGIHDVYDMSVDRNHNFVANNIVIHNTTCSSILFIWRLYLLSCMRDPQVSLGLTKGSKIHGVVISVNEQLALEVAFDNIVSKLEQSQYFKDHFPYTNNKGKLIFPKSIEIVARATTDRSALGMNMAVAWIDEAAFVSQGKAVKIDPRIGYIDHAELIYTSIKTRMKNTFKTSKFKGVFIVSSSKTTKDDFLARFIARHKNDPNLFLRDRNAFTISPELYVNSRKFKVLCGNELMSSRILKDSELHLYKELPEGVTIIDVPEEFEADFHANLERSIQDLAGIATSSVSPFIQRREKILEACDPNLWPRSLFDDNNNILLEHPFSVEEYDPTYPATFLWHKMVKEYYEREYVGYSKVMRPILYPNAIRHVHLDPSFRGDGFGICVGCIIGSTKVTRRSDTGQTFEEIAPIYLIDFMLRITPPVGGEIEMAMVRHLIYQLRDNGYKINCVSMDKYVRDGLQPFTAKGFNTEFVSVDETTAPYDTLKSALYENRIIFYNYPRLIQELQLLEKIYEGKRIKIDHPPAYGKDVADAMAGTVFTLSQRNYLAPLMPIKSSTPSDPWLDEKLGKSKEIYNQQVRDSFPFDFNNYEQDSGWNPFF